MSKQVTLTIDGLSVTVPEDYTIMQAADSVNIRIPRLCYHSKLSLFGACRVCVVEVNNARNYLPSCATQVRDGMIVQTHSSGVRKARKKIVELILSNHPANCQICGKNQSCELQGLAEEIGVRELPWDGEKKHFPIDASSASLVRDSEKCILCGKCVRVCSEVQGVNALSYVRRGFNTNVAPAFGRGMAESVCINCGQCITVCPTGALMEKDQTGEVWDNINNPDKVVVVQIAPAVRVAVAEGFGVEPGRDMTAEMVTALRMIGFDVVFDTQFSADLTIMEEGHEFIQRLTKGGKLPLITSCSPGWIKFCETFYPEFMDNLSSCKSPQQMMGALIKTYYAKTKNIDPSKIYSVSIMPCVAKKFEAARPEMDASGFRDVDVVLSTRELIKMIKQAGIVLPDLPKSDFDKLMGQSTGAAPIFGATGGVMEAALRTAYEVITGKELTDVNFNQVRGLAGIREAEVQVNDLKVKVAIASGLANAHALLADMKAGKRQYHFIEIMACPGGCMGGGGQPLLQCDCEAYDSGVYQKRSAGLYDIDAKKQLRKSHLNPEIKKIYADFLEKPLSKTSHHLLHTHYHTREPRGVPLSTTDAVNLFK